MLKIEASAPFYSGMSPRRGDIRLLLEWIPFRFSTPSQAQAVLNFNRSTPVALVSIIVAIDHGPGPLASLHLLAQTALDGQRGNGSESRKSRPTTRRRNGKPFARESNDAKVIIAICSRLSSRRLKKRKRSLAFASRRHHLEKDESALLKSLIENHHVSP